MIRLRITFTKTGSMRYTGHLDLQTVWERTVRRAGLPLAYTQGFHPGPRIQIASALPLGFIGHAEIVDVWLQDPTSTIPALPTEAALLPDAPLSPPASSLPYVEMLQPAAPPGLTIVSAEPVDEKGPALQTQVASAEYLVTFLDPISEEDLEQRLKDLLAAPSLPRERRGKPYDLRPLIESLSFSPPPLGDRETDSTRSVSRSAAEAGPGEAPSMGVKVFMRLSAREAATGRPEEVLAVLGIPFEATRIERLRIILQGVTTPWP
jgi:hypothetical protein